MRSALILVVVALGAACGGGASDEVAWRDLTVTLPDGWRELERHDTLLMLADGPPAEEPGQAGTLEAAVQFTVEPSPTADAWRTFVDEQAGDLERDEAIDLDGVRATLLQFSMVTNGIPTRERVVVVPSRQLVILQQPVPVQGQMDAPEVFLERIDEFDAVLATIEFGAPEGFLDE